ncbi:MAG: hypothetical protein IT427_18355 [Pirellulales bacterium]|nr:hypothetical protein [Pirellulales bacterium]
MCIAFARIRAVETCFSGWQGGVVRGWFHGVIFKNIFVVEMKERKSAFFPSAMRILAEFISGSFPVHFRFISGSFPVHFRFISGGVRKKTAGGSEMDREFTGVFAV